MFRVEYSIPLSWPPSNRQIIRYIGFLSLNHYSSSTTRSYISGISYKLKIQGNEDLTKSFIIQKLLGGCDRLYKSKDLREPLTIDILIRLNVALRHVCSSRYETILFQTAFNLAFAAFLRVSEFAITTNVMLEHVLHRRHVNIDYPFCKLDLEMMVLFFCHINGKSLTRFQFQTVLNKGLKFLSLNTSRFNTHSFRIGAATSAFMSGKTENKIKTMGRWMSSSFQRYIRIPNI
ncbi:uncharacterized protein LOC143043832 [Mytilus galloprovincialis]|uniref:uncharacterized protein LOC143043832 n=1 Tax=Mytilus galloprovincialis TaxID=29158 RepID=UPI003F7B66DC